MQVTSLLSQQQQPADCDCGHDHGGLQHSHTNTKLTQTLVGLILVLNAFVIEWVFPNGKTIAGVSAMIGAVILGYPIILVAVRDLRKGLLSINELVALGVLASAATGDFKTAGIVAFFMLLGEIIETRTAAGARASIESLIKLTPTKARRLVNGKDRAFRKDIQLGIRDNCCNLDNTVIVRIQPGHFHIDPDEVHFIGTNGGCGYRMRFKSL
jgi:Cd2+/Zn2+-exporting ATPase